MRQHIRTMATDLAPLCFFFLLLFFAIFFLVRHSKISVTERAVVDFLKFVFGMVQSSNLALVYRPAAGILLDFVRFVMDRWIAQCAIAVKFSFRTFPRFDCRNNSGVIL
jgi:hypothetical protein